MAAHRSHPLGADPGLVLAEHRSSTAARILAAADDLLLAHGSRGFTVADVAAKAYVGKGTVYLYWATKEDLLLGLIGRDFLAVAEYTMAALSADPELARPSQLCPFLLRTTGQRTLVKALQDNDDGLLGMLVADPRSMLLRDALGPIALLNVVLPSWRRNGLARQDWALDDQVLALNALIAGFQFTVRDHAVSSTDPYPVMAAAVTALLGSERATSAQLHDAASDIVAFLQHGRATALDLVGEPATDSTAQRSRVSSRSPAADPPTPPPSTHTAPKGIR